MELIDEDGCYNISPRHLDTMLDLVKNEEDIDIVIEAYYNFKGHKTIFSNKIVDKLLRTSVRVNSPQKVFDILAYHHYLLYYPHPETVNLLLNFFIDKNRTGQLHQFLKIIQERKLIQVDDTFLDTLEKTSIRWKEQGRNNKFIPKIIEEMRHRLNR